MTAFSRSADIHSRTPVACFLTGTLTIFLSSCGPSKVTQCNNLIAVANKAANETLAMSKSNNPDKMGELTKMADNFDQYAKEMAAVKLEDESLKGFQTRFVTMYQETSQASKDLAGAITERNARQAGRSVTALRAATGKESSLVDEVNRYCGGTKK